MNLTKRTALRVEQAIKDAGENKHSVSLKADITYPTLHRKLQGRAPGFTVKELGNIAAALNMRAADLIPEEDAA